MGISSAGIAALSSCLNRAWVKLMLGLDRRSVPHRVIYSSCMAAKLPVTSASISDHCSRTRAPARVNLVRFPPPIICAAECAFPVQESGKTSENKRFRLRSTIHRPKKMGIFALFGCIFCISAHISNIAIVQMFINLCVLDVEMLRLCANAAINLDVVP